MKAGIALVAEEILRRRHEERASSGQYKLGWLGALAAAILLWVKLKLASWNAQFR
jgi:Co/Zn/Cd efflux system component